MKLKEIIKNIFTSEAKKREEAEAKREAERRLAEEAKARKRAEETEAFLDKPYETMMSLVKKSIETTGEMTSPKLSSLLKFNEEESLLTFGFIGRNFVFKTEEKYNKNNFYVVKDKHLLIISDKFYAAEYQPEYKGGGYYKLGTFVGYKETYPSTNILTFTLDNKDVYNGTAYGYDQEDYQGLSEFFDFDPNLKNLFDKITFPGKDIKSKMTNPQDISLQDEIEKQLSESYTKYQNKEEEKRREAEKQQELERIAQEKAAREKEEAEKQEQERLRIKAMNDRLENNPALNIFLNSKGHSK